ncbi:MAG: 2'-5' RNA ligase family protein [Candidatus Limnocylindria bacterium]
MGGAGRWRRGARAALRVRTELRHGGIAFDAKPFQPHVTIARVPERQPSVAARAVAAAVAAARVRLGPIPVREVAVIESVLSPRGARYISRSVAPLAARATRRA